MPVSLIGVVCALDSWRSGYSHKARYVQQGLYAVLCEYMKLRMPATDDNLVRMWLIMKL